MPTPTQNLIPIPKIQFFDNTGLMLSGGSVYTYASDGATPKATYQDPYGSSVQPNPIVLDSAGRPLNGGIWGTGAYVFGVFNSVGVQIYTQPTQDPLVELNVSAAMLPVIQAPTTAQAVTLLGINTSSVPVGTTIAFAGPVTGSYSVPALWQLCAGQAISRSTYSLLFAVIGTTYGAGDGTSTFNVPDMRGRVPAGSDNMGGTLAGRMTANSSMGPAIGTAGGNELVQQHTHTTTVSDPGHQHSIDQSYSYSNVPQPGGGRSAVTANPLNAVYPTELAYTAIGVTVANYGGGVTGSQNVQPTMVMNYLIFAGA